MSRLGLENPRPCPSILTPAAHARSRLLARAPRVHPAVPGPGQPRGATPAAPDRVARADPVVPHRRGRRALHLAAGDRRGRRRRGGAVVRPGPGAPARRGGAGGTRRQRAARDEPGLGLGPPAPALGEGRGRELRPGLLHRPLGCAGPPRAGACAPSPRRPLPHARTATSAPPCSTPAFSPGTPGSGPGRSARSSPTSAPATPTPSSRPRSTSSPPGGRSSVTPCSCSSPT